MTVLQTWNRCEGPDDTASKMHGCLDIEESRRPWSRATGKVRPVHPSIHGSQEDRSGPLLLSGPGLSATHKCF
jgi:hypothetical protein